MQPRSVSFTAVVNAEDSDHIRRFHVEEDPPLADAQTQFTLTVFEGLHIAVACRRETYEGRINACLDDAIQTREITHGGRPEKYPPDHSPSRRRTSSKGRSSPGSARARSSLATVSASMISCSPSSARKEMATCTSASGRASTSDRRRSRSEDMSRL
ncbi:hypothetical protein SBA3_2300020 [Candidatus Sulfopaludibacter sp. SbA3]|nr:hypothetical protein SBA3_2300020 [Candidatus Sulfopaludibacter sp. SbA3]